MVFQWVDGIPEGFYVAGPVGRGGKHARDEGPTGGEVGFGGDGCIGGCVDAAGCSGCAVHGGGGTTDGIGFPWWFLGGGFQFEGFVHWVYACESGCHAVFCLTFFWWVELWFLVVVYFHGHVLRCGDMVDDVVYAWAMR